MSEFVNEHDRGMPRQGCIQIELHTDNSSVTESQGGQTLKPFQETLRLRPAVRLDIADNHVDTRFYVPRSLQHGVGFTHSGGSAEENAQPPSSRTRLLLLDFREQSVGIGP